MTELRDLFAVHCPDSWLAKAMPTTLGDIHTALVGRKLIPPPRGTHVDYLRAYTEADVKRLYVVLRYEYADAMLAARETAKSNL